MPPGSGHREQGASSNTVVNGPGLVLCAPTVCHEVMWERADIAIFQHHFRGT